MTSSWNCGSPFIFMFMKNNWKRNLFPPVRFCLFSMTTLILFFQFLFYTHSAQAQSLDFDAQSKGFHQMRQTGHLVTIELTPIGKELRLKLVGNEAAKVKVDQLSLEATYGLGNVKQRITVTKENENYIIKRDKTGPTDLRIRVNAKDQVEDFDFKLK